MRVSSEDFDSFSTRYPPHSDSLVMRSRRQILSVRRKYYAIDSMRVSSEGFYSFSTRYPPHSDSIVIGSRRQILSVRRKYYAMTRDEWPMRVFIRSPLDTLHTPIVLSLDPDAKYSPFGENTTLKTK